MAIHQWAINPARAYGLTKNAGAAAIQTIALDVSPDQMQVINFHPGAIFTDAAKDAGYTDQTLPWDERTSPPPPFLFLFLFLSRFRSRSRSRFLLVSCLIC